mgnify:CR=1 FL=1
MTRYRADENLPYFCTITILDWTPVFVETRYIEPLIESLSFCRVNNWCWCEKGFSHQQTSS